jgi:single-strand DNA-binding protein
MANDLNRCEFIGRLGADPEIRYLQSGDAVANMRIAVGSQWKSKSGEKQERTEWVPIVVWGKLAEICGQYLKKGSRIYISGRFATRKWQAKDGSDRYSTEVVVDINGTMQMLDGKSGGGQSGGAPSAGQQPRQDNSQPDGGFDDYLPF